MALFRLSVVVAQIPTIVVLVAGLALLTTRRATLPVRSVRLAVAGCVATLVGTVTGIGWSLTLPTLVSRSGLDFTSFGVMAFVVSATLTLLHAAGLGLLIAAVLTGSARAPSAVSSSAAPSSVSSSSVASAPPAPPSD